MKNKYAVYGLFIVSVIVFWNLLDYLYEVFIARNAWQFTPGGIGTPLSAAVIIGYILFIRNNRAALCRDLNGEDTAKICGELRKAGIPYTVKTHGSGTGTSMPFVRAPRSGRTGTIGGGFGSSGAQMASGAQSAWSDGESGNSFYDVYVEKKDLTRAKNISSFVL